MKKTTWTFKEPNLNSFNITKSKNSTLRLYKNAVSFENYLSVEEPCALCRAMNNSGCEHPESIELRMFFTVHRSSIKVISTEYSNRNNVFCLIIRSCDQSADFCINFENSEDGIIDMADIFQAITLWRYGTAIKLPPTYPVKVKERK